eukprot:TRINITY_DN33187_c0_g1_i1.p1 TRINITY_DN33187_c0_g1~~TRINITY_DN33187_c0_g1_i1.p1  ORF type:complete len:558 (+),score=211.00 TRINITY_DN33187_c0_g1_i1:50-1675(+)
MCSAARLSVAELVGELQTDVHALSGHLTSVVNTLGDDCDRLPTAASLYRAQQELCEALLKARRRICGAFELAADAIDDPTHRSSALRGIALAVNAERVHGVGLCGRPIVAQLGYHGGEKDSIQDLVLQLGGAFSSVVSQYTVTHVVCSPDRVSSGRVAKVAGWGLRLVSREWLLKSAAEGAFVPTDGYGVSPGCVAERTPAAQGLLAAAAERLQETQQMPSSAPRATYRPCTPPLAPPTDPARAGGGSRGRRLSRREVGVEDATPPPPKRVRLSPSAAPSTAADRDSTFATSSAGMQAEWDSLLETEQLSQRILWDTAAAEAAAAEQSLLQSIVVQLTAGPQHKAQKDAVVAGCRSLGATIDMYPRYSPRATHLFALAGAQTCSEKYLAFVAARKSIVDDRYVNESLAAGHWLPVDPYYSAGARAATIRDKDEPPFDGWHVLLYVQERAEKGLMVVLEAGGAVVHTLSAAALPQVTHLLTDVDGGALVVPRCAADPPELPPLSPQCVVLKAEFIFQYLTAELEEGDDLYSRHRVRLTPVWQ